MADPIAIYGAAIGTFAAVGVAWNIYDSTVRDSARIKIVLGREFTAEGANHRIRSIDPKVWRETEAWYPGASRRAIISVTNTGKRPTTVMEAGVEFLDRIRAAFEPGNSAQQLDQGQWTSFGISEGTLGRIVRQKGFPQYIYAQDAAMKMHRSTLAKELKPWLKQLSDVETMSKEEQAK